MADNIEVPEQATTDTNSNKTPDSSKITKGDDLLSRYNSILLGDEPPTKKSKSSSPSVEDYNRILRGEGDTSISPMLKGEVGEQDPDKYNFQMKPEVDNDLLRAENQSWYKQIGLGLANIVPNIATSLAGSLGQLSTLAQFGDDRTYSNELTDTMSRWHDPFGQIYAERPNDTFSPGDTAWWIKNASQLLEMTGQFALLGGGVGGILEKGAVGTAELLGAGARMTKALLGAGQIATSAALSYTIGAQMGAEVYSKAHDANYHRLLSQGIEPGQAEERAKHIASQAAATTVQLNTLLGFGLNLTSVLPIFKQSGDIIDFLSKGEGARQPGETLSAYKSRLEILGEKSPELAHALGIQTPLHYAGEAIKQAGEGALMEFSKRSGEREGKSGKTEGFFEQFNQLGNLLEDVTSSQGIMNGVLGIAGGVLNTAVLDRIPLHEDYIRQNGEAIPQTNSDGSPKVDSEGNQTYQTKMYSSREMAKNQRMAYFETAKEAVVTDIDKIQQHKDNLTKYTLSGNKDKVEAEMNDMLAVQQLHSITMGLADNIAEEYQELAKVDNSTDLGKKANEQAAIVEKQQKSILDSTGADNPDKLPDDLKEQFQQLDEQRKSLLSQSAQLAGVSPAIQKGLTQSMKDNSYVQRAADAVNDINTYQRWHKQIGEMFSFDSRNEEAHVAETVLHKMIQNHLYDRLITKIDTSNTLRRTELDVMSGPRLSIDEFSPIVVEYNRKIAQNNEVGHSFNDQLKALNNAINSDDPDKIEELVTKYKVDYSHGDLIKAATELSYKLAGLRDKKYAQAREAHDNLAKSLEYKLWSEKSENKDSTLADYIKELQKRSIDNQVLNDREKYLEQLRAEQQILGEQINKATSNPRKYASDVLKDFDKAKAELTERIKQENNTFNQKEREEKAAVALNDKQRQQVVKVWQQKIADAEKAIAGREHAIEGMVGTEQRSKLGKLIKWVRDPNLSKIKKELANLQAQKVFFTSKLSTVYMPLGDKDNSDTEEEDSQDELSSIPHQMEQEVLKMAAIANLPNMDINDIRDNVINQLSLLGIEKSKITADSLDSLIIRAMAAYKTAQEPDNSQIVDSLDTLLKSTANSSLIREMVDEILNDPSKFSWNYLNMEVAMGLLDTATAAKILQNVSTLINGEVHTEQQNTSTADSSDELPGTEEELSVVEDTPNPDNGPELPEPDAPLPIPDMSSDLEVVGRNITGGTITHIGMKSVTAMKINRLDLDYKDSDEGDYTINSISPNLIKGNGLSETMLQHGKIILGTKVKFTVDKNWKGSKKSDVTGNKTIQDSFDLYINKDGQIPPAQNLIDEVPIKITSEDGKEVLGYLPRVGWVLSKYKGADNFRNIAETETSDAVSEAARLRAVRKQIVNFFNLGSPDIITEVSERKSGHLIKNIDDTPQSAAKMLPDKKLEFGVLSGGDVKVGKKSISTKNIDMPLNERGMLGDNAPVAVVPMPNGNYALAPLFNKSIEPHETNTMLEAIRAYLTDDQKIIAAIAKHTDFNIATADGLRNFINQHYTYTNSFKKADLQPDIRPEAIPKFLFNITSEAGHQKGEISVGTAYSGKPKVTASIVGAKLHPEFIKAFTSGMKGRYKNIVFEDNSRGLKGVNSAGPINEIVYSKGAITLRKSHESYNDYVRSFSDTTVNGTNRLSNGEYVYGVHADTQLDQQQVMASRPAPTRKAVITEASLPDKDTSSKQSEKPVTPNFSAEDADLLNDGFMDNLPSFDNKGTVLQSLKELHTFTPGDSHNGKTPEQVYTELKQAGLEHLPEDFNPFLKC